MSTSAERPVPAPLLGSPWLTLKEAGRYVRASHHTILRAIKLGELPGYRLGVGDVGNWRVDRDELDAWIRRRRHAPDAPDAPDAPPDEADAATPSDRCVSA